MANTNFKVFAEAATTILSDAEYEADSQRTNGVTPGVAEPNLHNKLYKQATMMSAAIAQVLVERGFNAMDNNYSGLVAALRQALPVSVNNTKADANGNVTLVINTVKDTWPVNSVITTTDNVNPGTRPAFAGTTWEQIASGRCLIGAGAGYAAGATGGEATHTLSAAEMPTHKHSASVNSQGDHKHNRGTMNIEGRIGAISEEGVDYTTGAFYETGSGGTGHSGGWDKFVYMDASRNWTGETNTAGAHTHTVTVENAGSGSAHNNMQPYLVVYFWKRTA